MPDLLAADLSHFWPTLSASANTHHTPHTPHIHTHTHHTYTHTPHTHMHTHSCENGKVCRVHSEHTICRPPLAVTRSLPTETQQQLQCAFVHAGCVWGWRDARSALVLYGGLAGTKGLRQCQTPNSRVTTVPCFGFTATAPQA